MTVSSHSPIDIPASRAAARAVSRAWGRTPFSLHGKADFIPRITAIGGEAGGGRRCLNAWWTKTRPWPLGAEFLRVGVNRPLSCDTRWVRGEIKLGLWLSRHIERAPRHSCFDAALACGGLAG